jgi:hypothetical protein
MADLKLFHVSATLNIDMVVLAESQAQAEEVGKKNWYEEVRDAGLEPEGYYAREVTDAGQVEWMGEDNLDGCMPYGPEDRTFENGCSSPQLTLNEYMKQMGIE